MEWWNRVMNGVRAGIAAYQERALVPVEEWGFETYEARLARYWLYTSYINNTAYSAIDQVAGPLMRANKMYKRTRGIYNPTARQNKLLISYMYGGSIDMEHMTGGAIPIVASNDEIIDALRQLFTWSRWGEQKSLYVRWGASLGDVALKVVDDRQKEKVRVEVLHPGKIREAEFDEVGNVKSVMIEYKRTEEPDVSNMRPSRMGVSASTSRPVKEYTYTEVIDGEWFRTYKNGEPYAYYTDASGQPVAEWPNEYGFVPLVIANHANTGLKWGANAFYDSLRKVDEINSYASLLNDQLGKVLIPLLYATNVRSKKDIEVAADDPDKFTILYGPQDSELKPVTVPLDITAALANIANMQSELERDLPELALQTIRDKGGDFTAPGIRASYSDAIGRIIDARGNYDHAQVRAWQMAMSIGGYNRYDSFGPFNLQSYAAGDLEMYIKERPVIADSLSVSERLTFLGNVGSMPPALQRLALKEMDYSAEEIESVVSDGEEQVRNSVRGLAESLFGVDEEEEEATEDTTQDEDQATTVSRQNAPIEDKSI